MATRTRTTEETLSFRDARAFDAWLRRHHASVPAMLLKLPKKGVDVPSVTYAEAVERALAWGWIDGVRRALDDEFFVQRFSPRGPRSIWSKINRAKAEAMIADGRMQKPGLAAVERAKANGRWDAAYDGPAQAEVPADLAAALAKSAKAKQAFAGLNSRNRYAILHRLMTAKRPETRAKRIAEFVAMLARGDVLYP